MNLPLLALAISAFGIGTTEFVIMGLLPEVARDLQVSISSAGLLITGYALGVAIGAPIMAMLTARLPRKRALLALMLVFIVGNAFCALSDSYWLLMVARVVTALCHGAFFGIGAVTAASLVPPNRSASAVAMMFTGLTLANVLGVPAGTALGQAAGWRMTFWTVTVIGVIAFIALSRFLPKDGATEPADVRSELRSLANARVWMALGMTVLFSASMFALFTYIAPILGEITGVSPQGVTWTLLLIGVGLTIGNVIGGRLADWRLSTSLIGLAVLIALLQAAFYWTSAWLIPAELTLLLWGAASFAACAALQLNAMRAGAAAPSLISTLNIGAFNAGNALGAWLGSAVIASGLGLRPVTLWAAAMAVVALALTLLYFRKPAAPTHALLDGAQNC
jgi:DHA1 family inner membrane transport protein